MKQHKQKWRNNRKKIENKNSPSHVRVYQNTDDDR